MKEAKPKEVVVQEQLLLTLESAYPNILPVDDLAQYVCVHVQLLMFIKVSVILKNIVY